MLRLAHRLDMSPNRLAVRTGLSSGRQSTMASSVILTLDPQTATRFAHATHLTIGEVAGLTLASLAPRYPPLDLQTVGRRRQVHGLFIRENWIFARFTRYCPDCLAGDGNPIQQRYGGAWSKLWRLPVVFACPTHHRLLRNACPACQTPAHHRRPGSPQLLPLAAHPVTHPAACRNPTTATPPFQPCEQRLDDIRDASPGQRHVSEHNIGFQRRLVGLLTADQPGEAVSLGQPTTVSRYFVDLRILSALLQASWPAGRDLTDQADVDLVDEHVRRVRHQIASDRSAGRQVLESLVYDKPPMDSATAAALLGAADRILASEPATARHVLHESSTRRRSPATGPKHSSAATATARQACSPSPESKPAPNT
jgi:hypothetical protein